MKGTEEFSLYKKKVNRGAFETQKHGFFRYCLLFVHVCMLPLVTCRQHLLTPSVVFFKETLPWDLCVCECEQYLCSFVFQPLRLSLFAVVMSGHLLLELLIPPSALLPLCSHLLIYSVRH